MVTREIVNPEFKDKNLIVINSPNFRPGTRTSPIDVVYKFSAPGRKTAAMGDMICFLPAIEFIAEHYNHIQGHLVIPQYFMEIATNVLRKYPHWKFYTDIPERFMQGEGKPMKQQLEFPINPTSTHMLDLGFDYFVHTPIPDEFNRYPVLNLDGVEPPVLPYDYAVMTPVIEAQTRRMPADVFNGICDHLNKWGIRPVFLGKTGMAERNGTVDPKYDLTKGYDLINKTTLLEAAKIIQQSKMILGIDNGLLHLAAMTDATILYGFTIAGPTTRRIRRRNGWTIEMYGDKKQLPCMFCQEWMRGFFDHHFTHCIYLETVPACVRALNLESWCANIDMVIKGD